MTFTLTREQAEALYTDALGYSRTRNIALPADYYGDLPSEARQWAFSVAGISSADQLQSILDSMNKAILDGDSFATWKETALSTGGLGALSDARLENIFRTNIQGAYNRGRTLQHEQNRRRRPYLMYDAINDSRTRPAHAEMDGFIAHIDDPIWQRWTPPCGYQCRCRLIALTQRQAIDRGLNLQGSAPGVDPDQGWDYNRRATPLKGIDLAKQAQRERLDAALAAAAKARDKRGPLSIDELISLGTKEFDAVRFSPASAQAAQERIRQLVKDRVPTGHAPKVIGTKKAAEVTAQAAQMLPDSWTIASEQAGDLHVKITKARAHSLTLLRDYQAVRLKAFGTVINAKKGTGYMTTPADELNTTLHEFTHRIQATRPDIDALFQELHRRRTAGAPLKPLKSLQPNAAYGRNEVTREDGYYHPYQGKEYKEYGGAALEMFTMAIEALLGSPSRLQQMMEKDPEMAYFTLAILLYVT